MAVSVAFYNLSRFRAPVLAAALPLIGLAALEVVASVRSRSYGWLAAYAVAAAVPWAGLAVVGRPATPPVRAVDVTVAAYLWDEIASAEATPAEALATLDRALSTTDEMVVLMGERWSAADSRDVAQSLIGLARRASALARFVGSPEEPYVTRAARLAAAAK